MEPKDTLSKKYKFDNISYFLILSLGFLIPSFVIPFLGITSGVSKSVLVSTFVAVAFFLWLIARLKDGRFIFPKSIILLFGAILPVVLFFSSIFSTSPVNSFVGIGYEVGTFSSVLILFLFMFLSSIFFQKQKRIFYLYGTLFSAAVIVFLYQLVRFIFLSFGLPFSEIFYHIPGNLIGKWVDMSIFFGFIIILSLLAIEITSFSKIMKRVLYGLVGVSLLFLVIVNFELLWVIVGLFSLIIFVYSLSFGNSDKKIDSERRIPTAPFVVLLISLFFVLSGNLIGGSIYSFFRVPQETLRPSWTQTIDVAKSSLSENPIFGAGPNRFASQWSLFKPAEVNSGTLWNVNFNSGVGFIPSSMIVTGVIGIIAWVLFLLVFLYRGIVSVFLSRVKTVRSYTTVSSFLGALYLWVFLFFYTPNIVILSLAFLMTGIFIACLADIKLIKNYNFSFLDDPRIGFASVLVLILLIISSIAGGYILFQKFLAVGYFQKSLIVSSTTGNLNDASQYLSRAIKLNNSDLYYRTLSEVDLAKLAKLLSRKDVSKETISIEFKTISNSAVNNAILATKIDKTNYVNWVALAKVYQSLLLWGAPNKFYDSAKIAYDKAILLNPKDPTLMLAMARLEIIAKNKNEARKYIAKALNLKNNYTEAMFLLSQLQESEKDFKAAISSIELVSLIEPNEPGVFFKLGLLKYKTKDYKGAVSSFGRAVALSPNYSNAKYFLGISLYKTGDIKSAITQLKEVSSLNPSNTEVKNMLENLKDGRSIFADLSSRSSKNKDKSSEKK